MPNNFRDLSGQLLALRVAPFDDHALCVHPLPHCPRALAPTASCWWLCPTDRARLCAFRCRFNARLSPNRNGVWRGFKRSDADASEQPLLHMLSHMAIRHRKESLGGEVHVALPAIELEERAVEPRAEELAAIEALHAAIKRKIEAHYEEHSFGDCLGLVTSLLLQLRLGCDHPSLVRTAVQRLERAAGEAMQHVKQHRCKWTSLEEAIGKASKRGAAVAKYTDELLAPLGTAARGDGALPMCEICYDEMAVPALTPCKFPHLYCLTCLLSLGRAHATANCPTCRAPFDKSKLLAIDLRPTVPDDDARGAPASDTQGAPGASSKLEELVALLRSDTEAHPKSVVFTHFTGAQQLICERLEAEGVSYAQMAAGQSQRKRAAAFAAFTGDSSISVLVLSMKVAAVGLTLTCASRIVLFEPGLNLAAEQQAIGRCHRIGQTKPVQVVRLVLRGTVEEKIALLNRSTAAADGSSSSSGVEAIRLGEQKTLDQSQLLELLGLSRAALHAMQMQMRARPLIRP